MPPIYISVNGTAKLLEGLNSHKATGSDELPTRVLKEIAHVIAAMLTFIFQQSLDTREVQRDGAPQTSQQSTRKATGPNLQTMDQYPLPALLVNN